MLSNQLKLQDVPPLILFPAKIMKALKQKNWILFCQKSQHPQKMLVPQFIRPQSQFTDEQSNQMARCHLSPPDSDSHNDYEGTQAKNLNLVLSKESIAAKDVGTTVNKTTIPV